MKRKTRQKLATIVLMLTATSALLITSAGAMSRDSGHACSWVGALFGWC